MPEPFSPSPQVTVSQFLLTPLNRPLPKDCQIQKSPGEKQLSVIVKDAVFHPLGIHVMLSPKPPQHSLLCASGSCTLFLGKHPFREEANFSFLQTHSDYEWFPCIYEDGWSISSSSATTERTLTINTLPCLVLSQWLPSPSSALLTWAWRWSEGCGNRILFTDFGSYCQFQGTKTLPTPHPHLYS